MCKISCAIGKKKWCKKIHQSFEKALQRQKRYSYHGIITRDLHFLFRQLHHCATKTCCWSLLFFSLMVTIFQFCWSFYDGLFNNFEKIVSITKKNKRLQQQVSVAQWWRRRARNMKVTGSNTVIRVYFLPLRGFL